MPDMDGDAQLKTVAMSDDRTQAMTGRFDAAYYAHGCGPRPYGRDEVWLDFFRGVADRVVADIGPRTVLDAGCAMGFLVEMLHARGVEAWGIDVSEYAIAHVDETVREYCRVGSILEPLGRRVDMVACIEVLEHLTPTDGARAIANLCAVSDDVLFSSTPEDHGEPTHENVRPPDYWAVAFARHGFYRDVDFDATFLTPWAVRFRKHDGPPAPIVAAYERRLAWLERESADRRRAIAAGHERTAELLEQSAALTAEVAELRRERDAKHRQAALATAEAAAWRSQWVALERTRTWRFLKHIWGLRDRLLRSRGGGTERDRPR